MAASIEEITKEAIDLPRHQRLTLVRLLLDLDQPGASDEIERTLWANQEGNIVLGSLVVHLRGPEVRPATHVLGWVLVSDRQDVRVRVGRLRLRFFSFR